MIRKVHPIRVGSRVSTEHAKWVSAQEKVDKKEDGPIVDK
jgi:hypothetical protein